MNKLFAVEFKVGVGRYYTQPSPWAVYPLGVELVQGPYLLCDERGTTLHLVVRCDPAIGKQIGGIPLERPQPSGPIRILGISGGYPMPGPRDAIGLPIGSFADDKGWIAAFPHWHEILATDENPVEIEVEARYYTCRTQGTIPANTKTKAVGSPPWSVPSAPIWAHVSGYSPQNRIRKPLAFLHAYFDDSESRSGDCRLYVAGYLNAAANWALFSEAWNEELRTAPAIDYLRTSEALTFKGQFDGWDRIDRDEKLRGLARVARHFKPISFEVSVSVSEHRQLVAPVTPRGLQSARFSCCFGAVSLVSQFVAHNGGNVPIDFIFDSQDGVDSDLQMFFGQMIRSLPRSARKLINGVPRFEDDKVFLPLQAADLLAWHLRREHEIGSPNTGLLPPDAIRGEQHFAINIGREALERSARQLSNLQGIDQLQTKHRWRSFKHGLKELIAQGYIPPHGTRWRNFRHRVSEAVSRFLKSR